MAIQGARIAKWFPPHRLSADPTSAKIEIKLSTLYVFQHRLHTIHPPIHPFIHPSIHPSPLTFFTNTTSMIPSLSQVPASIMIQHFLSSIEGPKTLLSSSVSSGLNFLSKAISKNSVCSLGDPIVNPLKSFCEGGSLTRFASGVRLIAKTNSKIWQANLTFRQTMGYFISPQPTLYFAPSTDPSHSCRGQSKTYDSTVFLSHILAQLHRLVKGQLPKQKIELDRIYSL